ncbi:MAG: RidA family protein [Planctomycetota bacterium]
MNFDTRLNDLGLTLPNLGPPSGRYVHAVEDDGVLFVAGKGIDGVHGKLGKDFSLDEGVEFAQATGLLLLSAIRDALGTLNRLLRIIRVFGMVNCTPDFSNHPEVIDGCSDLLIEVFGDAGRHVRMAVGANSLPSQTPLEIELSLRIASDRHEQATVDQ